MEVHRCRFVPQSANGIHQIACTPSTANGETRVAICRQNGDTEIWSPVMDNRRVTWSCLGRVPGSTTSVIESLAFSIAVDGKCRLFTSSSAGDLNEIDLKSLTIIQKTDSFGGGSIWALAVSPSFKKLAAGCQDGAIRIYDISDGQLVYEKTFQHRHKGRVMCLEWLSEHELVAGGGGGSNIEGGSIRLFQTDTGSVKQRMSVGGSVGQEEEVFVWSLCRISDTLFASGDSLGQVKIWNFETCTLLQTIYHSSDILSVKSSVNGNTIFAGSMDGKILQLKLVDGGRRFINTLTRKFHERDLQSLVWIQVSAQAGIGGGKRKRKGEQASIKVQYEALVSGGLDSNITVLNDCEKMFSTNIQPTRIAPYHSTDSVCISPSKRRVLAMYDDKVGLWSLGAVSDISAEDYCSGYKPVDYVQQLSENARYLCQVVTKNHLNPYATAMSKCGRWVAICEQLGLHLYSVVDSSCGAATLKDVSDHVSGMPVVRLASFSHDGHHLACGGVDGSVWLYDLDSFVSQSWKLTKFALKQIRFLDANTIVCLDSANKMFVIKVDMGPIETNVPQMEDAVVDLIEPVDYHKRKLVLGIANVSDGTKRLFAFDLDGKVAALNKALQSIEWLKHRRESIIGLRTQISTEGELLLYLYSANWIGRIDVEALLRSYKKSKTKMQKCCQFTHRFSNISHFEFTDQAGEQEAVLVETSPASFE
jgi:WD40 repeat protein